MAKRTCRCGQELWGSREDAVEALLEAKLRSALSPSRVELRVDACPNGAGWHISERAAPDRPTYEPSDDGAAEAFIDAHLSRPLSEEPWPDLASARYRAQTVRVMAGMLRGLEAIQSARRKATNDECSRVGQRASPDERQAAIQQIRAAHQREAARLTARREAITARRRELKAALDATREAEREERRKESRDTYFDALRHLAVAVDQHRAETAEPSAADRRLWAWLDVLVVPGSPAGQTKAALAKLVSGEWGPARVEGDASRHE